jgi:hypothetical protein
MIDKTEKFPFFFGTRTTRAFRLASIPLPVPFCK